MMQNGRTSAISKVGLTLFKGDPFVSTEENRKRTLSLGPTGMSQTIIILMASQVALRDTDRNTGGFGRS
jgi:hypothetical protein